MKEESKYFLVWSNFLATFVTESMQFLTSIGQLKIEGNFLENLEQLMESPISGRRTLSVSRRHWGVWVGKGTGRQCKTQTSERGWNQLEQTDVSFSCVCPFIDHEFRHNVVKVTSLSIIRQAHKKTGFNLSFYNTVKPLPKTAILGTDESGRYGETGMRYDTCFFGGYNVFILIPLKILFSYKLKSYMYLVKIKKY